MINKQNNQLSERVAFELGFKPDKYYTAAQKMFISNTKGNLNSNFGN